MIADRRRQWLVALALASVLAGGAAQPLRAETAGASAEGGPTDARIERLREAIEREREALESEREVRRSMEEEVGRMRDELERTRQELEALKRDAEPDAGAGN